MEHDVNILALGLSHKTAPVEVREKLAMSRPAGQHLLEKLRGFNGIREAMVVSTCNRMELYTVVNSLGSAIRFEKEAIADLQGISVLDFELYLYALSGLDAVHHIFRVAGSLDSMVIGEPQILGQVKDAYRQSIQCKAAGAIINKLMQRAFHAAKRIRTETGIGKAAVSVSYAAVQLAKKIFGDLKGKNVLIMGAGDMGELVTRHLVSSSVGEIFVTNRTYSRAEELAEVFNGHAVYYERFPEILHKVDIVICSTGAPHYIIRAEALKEILRARGYKPMFFIDISVPRNIDPEVNNIENVYLYDIDDLEEVVWGNLKAREKDIEKAEEIIKEEVNTFAQWLEELKLVPVIVKLRETAMQVSGVELEEAFTRLKNMTKDQRDVIRTMAEAIINKMLHKPITTLKKMQRNGEIYIYLEAVRRFFITEEAEADEGNQDRDEGE